MIKGEARLGQEAGGDGGGRSEVGEDQRGAAVRGMGKR
jgi:hypothetical protein